MRLLRLPLFLISFLPLLCYSQQLQCFNCINRLQSNEITQRERNALRSVLNDRFNIPPSNEYCADGGGEYLFRTVERKKCDGINDTCVRIITEGDENRKLVIRGCQSALVKNGYDLITNFSCHSDSSSSECVTTCQTHLCNNSHGFSLIPLLIMLFRIGFELF